MAIGAACLVAPLRAVDPARAMSQYIRDQWGADKGFPGGPVHGITQTRDGYLWIAAERGLVRFDGFTFKLFEPTALVPNSRATVRGIAADPAGDLWARLRGPARLRYRSGRFENIPSPIDQPDSVLTAMSRGTDGAVLFAPLGLGVLAQRGGRLITLVPPEVLPGEFVTAVAEASDGDVWVGTRDSGVLRVQARGVTRIDRGLPDRKINSLLAGGPGELWIGTDNGVVRWKDGAADPGGVPESLRRVSVLSMIRDRDANVWIATADSLFRVNVRGARPLVDRDVRSRSAVTALFEDRDGNIWIGTPNGVERLRDGVFVTYSTATGLPSDGIGPLHVDQENRTWFAPAEGGLYWLRDGEVHRVTVGGLTEEVIYSMAGGPGEVWIGGQKCGLIRLRLTGDAVGIERFTQADGLAQNSVYAVHRARDGSIWAGTLSGGVSRYHAGAFTTYTKGDGLASNTVASILESADGTMWFATPSGVSLLSRGGWRRFTTADGLPSDDVATLAQDSAGRVWAGTAAGLAVFQAGGLRRIANAPAALGGSILGLADDHKGALWIATADRILRADLERLDAGMLREQDVREYGIGDGPLGLEGVKRHRSVVADPRGRIWISTRRGLSMADAGRASVPALPALSQIETVTADGMPVDATGRMHVAPGPQRITVAYTGLSLSMPERVSYRYRLDGFDRDWSPPTTARQAVFTNLGPGPYTFRVTASNADGAWSGQEAVVGFEIDPAVWQTRWFRVSIVLACVMAAAGIYRLRVMQLGRQLNIRFEERLAERTRVAQDLHDTLLQGFVSASMQLHVAADRLPPDSDARSSLVRVQELMGRVIEEGRQAVRGLRAPAAAGANLEHALAGVPGELALAGKASYRVIVDGRPRTLDPMIRDEVYRIAREALVNAFRHSGATAIEVEVEYAGDLRILVRDDGRGIDARVVESGAEGHWGLSGMRERAERIGASVKVFTRASAGTEVELTVPARVAFAKGRKTNHD